MTAMAAEAGDAAVESEAADSSAAGRTVTRSRTSGQQRQSKHRVRTAALSVAGPEGAATARVANRRSGQRQAAQRPQRRPGVSRSQEFSKGFPGSGAPSGNYHGVILAEWAVGTVLIISIPFSHPNQTGVSPLTGKELVQLATYTVLFWILAILAATGRTQARFAAWFGGLILLAVGLAEAAAIATAVKEWLPGGTTTPAPAAPAGNPSTVNPGSSEPATGISRPPAQAPGNGLT